MKDDAEADEAAAEEDRRGQSSCGCLPFAARLRPDKIFQLLKVKPTVDSRGTDHSQRNRRFGN